jgi:hypothetical protein
MHSCIVEDVLIGAAPKRGGAEKQEVSIQVNVLTAAADEPPFGWMRVHTSIAFRLSALAELQGPDGLLGRCCTIGVDESGQVVSLTL